MSGLLRPKQRKPRDMFAAENDEDDRKRPKHVHTHDVVARRQVMHCIRSLHVLDILSLDIKPDHGAGHSRYDHKK